MVWALALEAEGPGLKPALPRKNLIFLTITTEVRHYVMASSALLLMLVPWVAKGGMNINGPEGTCQVGGVWLSEIDAALRVSRLCVLVCTLVSRWARTSLLPCLLSIKY